MSPKTNMDQGEPGYALTQLRLGIDVLATHPENIKERIKVAHHEAFGLIQDRDIPEELQPIWNEIKEKIKGKGPRKNKDGEIYVSALDNTLHYRHKRTLSKAAYLITELCEKLDSYLRDKYNKTKESEQGGY